MWGAISGASVFRLSQTVLDCVRELLVKQAGDVGKTITFGTTSQLATYAGDTAAYQAAAQAIGLKVALKSVSAQDYIEFFTDPKFRAGIDALPGVNSGDYGDPAALLAQIVLPGGCRTLTASATRRLLRRWSRPAVRRIRTSGRRWWLRPRS
jgi:ABC-type transport system substrate-binding protein